jgi:hypothetical protein
MPYFGRNIDLFFFFENNGFFFFELNVLKSSDSITTDWYTSDGFRSKLNRIYENSHILFLNQFNAFYVNAYHCRVLLMGNINLTKSSHHVWLCWMPHEPSSKTPKGKSITTNKMTNRKRTRNNLQNTTQKNERSCNMNLTKNREVISDDPEG